MDEDCGGLTEECGTGTDTVESLRCISDPSIFSDLWLEEEGGLAGGVQYCVQEFVQDTFRRCQRGPQNLQIIQLTGLVLTFGLRESESAMIPPRIPCK